MNILLKANEIVFERNEEKERLYGPFQEGMQEAAKIASLLSRKEITTVDMYNCMMALKLSRASYNYKEDNYKLRTTPLNYVVEVFGCILCFYVWYKKG